VTDCPLPRRPASGETEWPDVVIVPRGLVPALIVLGAAEAPGAPQSGRPPVSVSARVMPPAARGHGRPTS
jgi:hypothetical protein